MTCTTVGTISFSILSFAVLLASALHCHFSF
jgi:hypothetical protein